MGRKMKKLSAGALAGSLLAAGPALSACTLGPTYEQWASTDGAAGRINLDEVQHAFKNAQSASEFERRVNEIYEGDGMVLIRARQDDNALILEGWEDLNNNFEIDDSNDDKLFDIVERNEQNNMRGYGGNGYYQSGFGGSNFLFAYLLISATSPRGYYYNTPPQYARGTLNNYRTRYRNSNLYRSQVSRNSRYFTTNKGGFKGSQYSTARQSYQSNQQKTGAFRRSSTGVRNSWGASTRTSGYRGSGRGGGFRGYGGGQSVVTPRET